MHVHFEFEEGAQHRAFAHDVLLVSNVDLGL